jgi:molybdopterin-guanine dinucleotide biosynthesis protein A
MSHGGCTCIVLAGGQSRRMGANKAFLDIGGRPMIEWTLAGLNCPQRQVLIVTNTPEVYRYLGRRVATDLYPGRGVLGGLYTGLYYAETELALVVGCDMPFLNRALLDYQISLAAGYDAVVLRVGDFFEPLHAVYTRSCLEPIRVALESEQQRLMDFYGAVRVRYVERDEIERFDPQHLSFVNVNTPADLERVRRIAAEMPAPVWPQPG